MTGAYQLNPFAAPPLVTAAVVFVLAVTVPIRERRSHASILFSVLCLALSVWLGAFSIMYLAADERLAQWWCHVGYLGLPFIPAAIFHFTLVLLGKYQQHRFYVWLTWALSLFFSEQLISSDFVVTRLDRTWWGYYPRFSAQGFLFLVFFLTPMLASMWHFWADSRHVAGEKQRQRIHAFMLAFSVGYVALVDFFPAFGIEIYPFGYLPILAFAVLSVAAIRRHRLVVITPAYAADQIMDTMSGAVIVTDQTDTITVANRSACQMLGYQPGEVIGLPISRILLNPISEGSPRLYRNQPMSWRRKDGAIIDVSVSGSILGPKGEIPDGIVYTALDLSELKHAEAEVRSTISLLMSTLGSTTDGILVIDLGGKIVSFNQRFVQMWGIPQEVLDTRDDSRAIEFVLSQLKYPDLFVTKISELYAHPEAESFDVLEFKDGRILERYSVAQRLDGRPVGRVWSFRDVTERKRAEESLKRRDMIMEAMSFAAEQFLMTADWTTSIERVLAQLGRATGVSRVYIYQKLSPQAAETAFRHRYEWVAEGIPSYAADPRFQNIGTEKGFVTWGEQLIRGEVVQAHARDFTPEQAEALRGIPLKSMIVVPIMVGGRLWGVIGFSDLVREREWQPIEIEALKAAAEILGAAIQRREASEALQASETRYQLLFERNLAGVYRNTLDGHFLDCNEACARIFGYTREEFLKLDAAQLYFDPSERERFVRQLLERRALTNIELRLRRRDGTPVWVLENVSMLLEEGGEPILEGTLIDITDRKVAEQQVQFQAYHDALTGLPNRMLFQDRLGVAVAHAHRLHHTVTVMFLDLDHFKFVNDTLGHTIGDLLLEGVAERLTNSLREEDTVARLGGDEFTLLLSHLGAEDDAAKVAQKLLETVAKPFTIDDQDLYVTTSIGIAMYPDDGDDAETLLKNADSAMYRAKELGRNTYQMCTPAMNRRALERMSLENSLRRALDRQEFVVYYQPQVELASSQIVGMEALVRWNHPDGRLVGPTEFIGVAEDSRLIFPLGEWVLREACRQMKAWHQKFGCSSIRIAVNLSARQFQQRDLIKTIDRALSETGLHPQCLELEITEGIAMQNTEYSIAIMRELKSMGIRIAMDDFGTGHSSLSYLKRFPIDTIKIDQSFIRDLRAGIDTAIVVAMITMAQGKQLRIIAEGVETNEQMEFLRANHCQVIQGFLFSPPQPAAEIEPLLRAAPSARRAAK